MQEALSYLEHAASWPRGLHASVRVYAAIGAADHAIADYARELAVDLVVMATHGRGGLTRLVLGSVATAVLHLLRCPLLLVRPRPVSERVPGLATERLPAAAGLGA